MTLALALALTLAASPAQPMEMKPLFEVLLYEPGARAKLDASKQQLLAVYEQHLAGGLDGAPKHVDSYRVDALEQSFLPGQLLRASGWTDGGHGLLRGALLLVEKGAPRVLFAKVTRLDENGYDAQLDGVLACDAAYAGRARAVFDAPGDFQAKLSALEQELCTRVDLAAAARAVPSDAASLSRFAELLAVLVDEAVGARVVANEKALAEPKLEALLKAKAARVHEARWVEKVEPFPPLAVDAKARTASGAMVVQESRRTAWLKRFELKLSSGAPSFRLRSLASTITYIE